MYSKKQQQQSLVQAIQHNLQEGLKNLTLTQEDRILFIGNTGSGKSTLINYLAGAKLQVIKEKGLLRILLATDEDVNKYMKIGHKQTSETVVPRLLQDKSLGWSYCDCPGFGDVRGPEYDIPNALFLNKVTDARKIKIVWTTSFAGLTSPEGRGEGFIEVLRQTLDVAGGFEKIKEGLIMVVTGVEAHIKTKDIHEILKDFVITRNLNKEIADSINYLVTNGKIGFTFKPIDIGPVEQKQRECILNLIKKTSSITGIKKLFKRTISKNSQLAIEGLSMDLNAKVEQCAIRFGGSLYKDYLTQIKNCSNLVELNSSLRNITDVLEEIGNSQFETPAALVQTIQDKLNTLGIQLTVQEKTELTTIQQYDNDLQFLKSICPENTKFLTEKWKSGLLSLTINLNTAFQAYSLLIHICQFLSGWTVQSTRNNYDVIDLSKWGVNAQKEEQRQSGLKITKDNYKTFHATLWRKHQHFFAAHYTYMSEFDFAEHSKEGEKVQNDGKVNPLEKYYINDLNAILALTLRSQFTIEITQAKAKLIAEAPFLRLSDVLPKVADTIKSVELYASHTVFLDDNVNMSGKNFIIIAPKWEVIGAITINLSGKAGDAYTNPASNASEGTYQADGKGSNGINGLPGKAGLPGGNFFGMAQEVINSESLEINVTGGAGGPGQKGGNGSIGKKGDDAGPKELDLQSRKNIGYYEEHPGNNLLLTVQYYTYSAYGQQGKRGGDGGQGGEGGNGGLPGTAQIINLGERKIETMIKSAKGIKGADGEAGKPGRGGEYGRTIFGTFCQTKTNEAGFNCASAFSFGLYTMVSMTQRKEGWENLYHKEDERQVPKETKGKKPSQKNGSGKIDAVAAENIVDLNAIAVSTSKRLFRENLTDKTQKEIIEQFLLQCKTNTEVRKKITLLGLFEDRQNLEKQVSCLSGKVDLLSFFESLYDDAQKYSQQNLLSQHNKVMSYLLASILSRICCLRAASDRLLVIDIKDSLQQAQDHINKLQKHGKQAVISIYQKEYQDQTQDQLKDVQQFTSKLEEDLKACLSEIDSRIQSLLREIEQLKKNLNDKQVELINRREQLKKLIPMKMLFGTLSIACKCLSFVGSHGKFVGEVLNAGLDVAKDFALSDNNNNKSSTVITIPRGVENTITDGANFLMRKYNDMESKQEERLQVRREVLDKGVGELEISYKEKIEAVNDEEEANNLLKEKDGLIRILQDTKKAELDLEKKSQSVVHKALGKIEPILKRMDTAVQVAKAGVDRHCLSGIMKLEEMAKYPSRVA